MAFRWSSGSGPLKKRPNGGKEHDGEILTISCVTGVDFG